MEELVRRPTAQHTPRRSNQTRFDGPLMNAALGMGSAKRDPSIYTDLNPNHPFLDERRLSQYHRQFWQAKGAVDKPPEKMGKKWGVYKLLEVSQDEEKQTGEPDSQKQMNALIRAYNNKFVKAQQLANLQGNAAIVLFTDTGSLDEPLDLSKLGKVTGSKVVDRWSLYPDITDWYNNFDDDEGPEWFNTYSTRSNITIEGKRVELPGRIHGSRVLWFRGAEILSERERVRNQGCDDSILQSLYHCINRYELAFAQAERLSSQIGILNHKVAGLQEGLMTRGAEYQSYLISRSQVNDLTRSGYQTLFSDKDNEEMSFLQISLSGVSEVMEAAKNDMIAAIGNLTGLTPSQVYNIFYSGMDSAGKNAGQRDAENDGIAILQKSKFGTQINKLINILQSQKQGPFKGNPPDREDWVWQWLPYHEKTEEENADLVSKTATSDRIYVDLGVLDAQYLQNRFTGERFDPYVPLTEADIERINADQEGESEGTALTMPELPEDLEQLSLDELLELEQQLDKGEGQA